MEGSDSGLTKVRILNQFYTVKSDNDPAYVKRLAEYVDHKLSQVSEGTPSVDTLKVAILTALNIADELFRARENAGECDEWYQERIGECNLLLDQFNS